MAYGPNYRAVFRRAAVYVDKIEARRPSRGAADQVRACHQRTLIARADEVIE
jgi:hypothetical protein